MQINRSIEIYQKFHAAVMSHDRDTRKNNQEIRSVYEALIGMLAGTRSVNKNYNTAAKMIAESLIQIIVSEFGFTTSTNTVRDEIAAEEYGIAKVVKPNKMGISEMNGNNFDNYVHYHTLICIHGMLLADADKTDELDSQMRLELQTAYQQLNDIDFYYRIKKSSIVVGNSTTAVRTIYQVIEEVLNSFLREKGKLYKQLAKLRELESAQTFSREMSNIVSNELNPENTVYFGGIGLGSDSPYALRKDWWTCGQCQNNQNAERPLLQVNSSIFMSRVSESKLNGSIRFPLLKCPTCGKYNILPGTYMECIAETLGRINMEVGSNTAFAGEDYPIDVGAGILESARQLLDTKVGSIEDPILREEYANSQGDIPVVSQVEYQTITQHKEIPVEEYDSVVKSMVSDIRKALALGHSIYSKEYLDEVAAEATVNEESVHVDDVVIFDDEEEIPDILEGDLPSNAGTDLSGVKVNMLEPYAPQAEIMHEITPIYGDRIDYIGDKFKILYPSNLFLGFADFILRDSAVLSMAEEDFLLNLCATSSEFYGLTNYCADLSTLLRGIQNTRTAFRAFGRYLDAGCYMGMDLLREFVETLQKLARFDEFKTIELEWLDAARDSIRNSPKDIDDLDAWILSETQRIMHECRTLNIPLNDDWAASYIRERYIEESDGMRFVKTGNINAYIVIVEQGFIIMEKAIAQALVETEQKLVEEVRRAVQLHKYSIRRVKFTGNSKLPLYLLRRTLVDKLIREIYPRALINTLAEADLVGFFNLMMKDTQTPFSLYTEECKRLRHIFSRLDIPHATQLLFCGVVFNAIAAIGAKDSDITSLEIMGTETVKRLKMGIPDGTGPNAYANFIGNLYCGIINIIPDTKTFKTVTYIDSSLLNLSGNSYTPNNMDLLIASISRQGAQSQLSTDMLDYCYQLADEFPGNLSYGGSPDSIWINSEENQDRVDEIRERKLDAITAIVTLYSDCLSGAMYDVMTSDINKFN